MEKTHFDHINSRQSSTSNKDATWDMETEISVEFPDSHAVSEHVTSDGCTTRLSTQHVGIPHVSDINQIVLVINIYEHLLVENCVLQLCSS